MGHFLELFQGRKPDDAARQAMNVSLILYAEHEFNASTFAARIAASNLSDFYSAVIGTLRG
jgi:2-methylcitrate synthase